MHSEHRSGKYCEALQFSFSKKDAGSKAPLTVITLILSFLLIMSFPFAAEVNPINTARDGGIQQIQIPSPDSPLYNILKSDIASSVSREVQEKTDRQFSWFTTFASTIGTIVIGLIAFIGYKSYSDLKISVARDVIDNNDFKDMVVEAIRRAVDEQASRADIEIKFFRFKSMVDEIAAKDTFSVAERQILVDGLNSFKGKEITRTAEFAATFEKAIDQFFSAEYFEYLPPIEDEFQEVVKENRGVIITLLQVYGMRVLGEVECGEDARSRFHRYLEICRGMKYYEFALPYLMVLEFYEKKDGWENRLRGYIEDAALLTPQEKGTLLNLLERYSNFTHNTTTRASRAVRMTAAYNAFWTEYNDKIKEALAEPAPPEQTTVTEAA